MSVAPVELLRKIEKGEQLPRVLVIHGEEDYYRSMLTAKLTEHFLGEIPPAERSVNVFAADTDLQELEAVVNTYPFFCGISLVVLKDEKLWAKSDSENKKRQLEKLLALLQDVPEYCYVIVEAEKFDKRTAFFKGLVKKFTVCECQKMRVENLPSWLKDQAAVHGAVFDRDALTAVLEYLAAVEYAPLELLHQEITKLAVYAGERKNWTRADVENIFSALPEVSGFTLLKAIAAKDLQGSLKILAAERKNGTNILPICGLVLYQLRKMLRFLEFIRAGCDRETIIKELKMIGFLYAKESSNYLRFSETDLAKAICDITELNIQMRKGGRTYARLEEILLELLQQ